MISEQPAICAGTPSMSTVENNGAVPPGIYKPTLSIANRVINAGSVFIGPFSPESAGDYASGTNHTLPTNGFAKAYSGVSVDSFVKKITYQKLTKEGLEGIAQTVIEMAEAEGLQAHAQSVRVRIEPDLKKT